MNFNLKTPFLASKQQFPFWKPSWLIHHAKIRTSGGHITPGTSLVGTELFGEGGFWWPNLLGRKTSPSSPVAAPGEFPGCSPHLEMCAGSPKNELLSGQQVLKLLLPVLSRKSRHWLGKGGDNRAVGQTLNMGEGCDFSFSLE